MSNPYNPGLTISHRTIESDKLSSCASRVKVLHMGKSFFSWSVPFRVVVQGRQGRLLFLTFTTLTNDIGLLRITSGAYQLGLGVGGAHVIRALGVEIYLRPLSL